MKGLRRAKLATTGISRAGSRHRDTVTVCT
jgi:hypothetical protein